MKKDCSRDSNLQGCFEQRLVEVKAHQAEPANEGADILADKAISIRR